MSNDFFLLYYSNCINGQKLGRVIVRPWHSAFPGVHRRPSRSFSIEIALDNTTAKGSFYAPLQTFTEEETMMKETGLNF